MPSLVWVYRAFFMEFWLDTVKYKIKTYRQEKELDVSKVVKVQSKNDFIYFDKLKDGTYRVVYSNDTLKDYTEM